LKDSKNVIGLIFSLAVIGYVLLRLDWPTTIETVTHLNIGWLAFAFGVYLINYVLRTIRFRTLLNQSEITFIELFGVTSLYGMYLYLMPAKSGDLSYPILLKKQLKVSLISGAATLIVARFFDFVAVALFLPVVLISFWDQVPWWVRSSGMIFSLGVLVFGVIASWWLCRSDMALSHKFQVQHPSSKKAADQVKRALYKLLISLQEIDRNGQYWYIFVLTIAIWFCVQTTFYLIVMSLGYRLTFFQILVVSIIMVPLTLFPLQGFANLGTHEVGWVAAFTLFRQPQSVSLNIAVSSHIVLLFFVLMLGLIGYLLLRGKTALETAAWP
jgi:uncharacterized protein (TIRG00374 family)